MGHQRQVSLQDRMKENFVVIFPDQNLNAWDHMPRFTFLDADLYKLQNKEQVKTRLHQTIKSRFVGSPVRSPEEGGIKIITKNLHSSAHDQEEEIVKPPKVNGAGEGINLKGYDFQNFINDIGMLKLREKISASASISMTKTQRTRQANF